MSPLVVRVTIRRLALLLVLVSVPAAAQSNRVFVSARNGNDLNSCNNILTPCQTLQGAVNQVAAGGSVIVLATGGYGAVTIGKGLTIEAPSGVVAFIHPTTLDAITVNAGLSDVVILRGLSLNSGSRAGIMYSTGAVLQVEHCVVSGFGIAIWHLGNGRLNIKDTTIRNGGTGVMVGEPSAVSARQVTIERTSLKSNNYGIIVHSGSMTIRKASISSNLQGGILVTALVAGAASEVNVEDCVVANNGGTGIDADSHVDGAPARVRVSNSTVVYNDLGLRNHGSLLSRNNNTVEANLIDSSGSINPYSAK